MTSALKSIFDTDSAPVHDILNLDIGVNLASIGNKVYLIHCGDLVTETTTTSAPTTTTTTTVGTVSVSQPAGGEVYVLGDTINITWSSNKGVNNAVSIELKQGNDLVTEVVSKTSNTGSYFWQIPLGLDVGVGYYFVITWLSAQEDNSANASNSGNFALALEATTTTTTTEAPDTSGIPDYNNCRGIPILDLGSEEYVTRMIKDTSRGGILFATSLGRILFSREAVVNAYLTGKRNVYAEVKDGFGNVSQTKWRDLTYGLYNKIAQVNSSKEIVKWEFVEKPAAITADVLKAVFLSPILSVNEDFGFWTTLLWEEQKSTDTSIIVCLRAGDSVEDVKRKEWDICFHSIDSDYSYHGTGVITRDLLATALSGRYVQIKVLMSSYSENVSPIVSRVVLSYTTKYAVYFFTTKFSLTDDASSKNGLITANITEPQNTEVKFGISELNSADWDDYKVVEVNRFFELDNLDNVKVGVKFISYGDNAAEVGEFALLTGTEEDTQINRS